MVRAILAGAKSVTRRVVKPQPTRSLPHTEHLAGGDGSWSIHHPLGWRWSGSKGRGFFSADESGYFAEALARHCPYGAVGDRLWVRETWRQSPSGDDRSFHFRADEDEPPAEGCWKPSIFMPRWASRITLEVTSVRVERLQDLTDEQANAEGVTLGAPCVSTTPGTAHIREFYALWEMINGKRPGCAWVDNPWVWAVSFRRVEGK